jgi:hypothetical protein
MARGRSKPWGTRAKRGLETRIRVGCCDLHGVKGFDYTSIAARGIGSFASRLRSYPWNLIRLIPAKGARRGRRDRRPPRSLSSLEGAPAR